MESSEDRQNVIKKALEEIKAKCGFRCITRCCDTCYYHDYDENDGTPFCGHPDNEWKDARPGEPCAFELPGCTSVCDKWTRERSCGEKADT